MEMIFTQVGNFGFPMVVAIYLLVRVEKKLDELTIAINDLGKAVEKNTF
ncbi:MAG: YvrJ family protein [Bacillota bacterium]